MSQISHQLYAHDRLSIIVQQKECEQKMRRQLGEISQMPYLS